MKYSLTLLTALLLTPLALLAAPKGLTTAAADKFMAEQFAALQAATNTSALPVTLPEPIQSELASGNKADLKSGRLDLGGELSMPFAVILRQTTNSAAKRPLFISMHGGGGSGKQPGPHTWDVNTREFKTQVTFAVKHYQPDGVYFVPRMADDRLGRWWHKHNQVAFDQVINHAILHWNVDPNRVYLMGVSEGGYGTDILAPFMADRFAGANAMAAGVGLGNPPANLRNLAFRTDVGETDYQFDRSPLAQKFHAELDRLQQLDPGGYVHSINLQAGRAHGIDYRQGILWITKYSRPPWPDRVVWVNQPLDGLRRERFYWVAIPAAPEKGDLRIDAAANRKNNTITIDIATLDGGNLDGNRTHGKDNVAEAHRTALGKTGVNLLLSDALLDLDKPVTVVANGKRVFNKKVARSARVIAAALAARPDPSACPTAIITVTTPDL
ncbi:MAG: hypothetical protein MUF81_15420 [Verrucomicrobia bacterium]|jgi:hypothetical protein|nr:hypothetical protein [Verrucomicrobiota bacterium]